MMAIVRSNLSKEACDKSSFRSDSSADEHDNTPKLLSDNKSGYDTEDPISVLTMRISFRWQTELTSRMIRYLLRMTSRLEMTTVRVIASQPTAILTGMTHLIKTGNYVTK